MVIRIQSGQSTRGRSRGPWSGWSPSEAVLWEGGRGAPTPAEVARESGLPESEVLLALEALGRLLDDRPPRTRG